MSTYDPTRALVRCDGVTPPRGWAGTPWTRTLDVISRGARADLNLRVEDLAGVLGTEVGDRARDLVRIAAYAYQADRLVSRGGDRDASVTHWRRHLGLCVPVADPGYWNEPGVTDRLTAALQFLTDDYWQFHFARGLPVQRQLHLLRGASPLHREPDSVVLFSGGADSLAVLLEAAARGERPLAVGHWSSAPHEARQRQLLDHLRERVPTWTFPPLGFKVHGRRREAAERTRRSRAFLFAALGAAVAAEVGVGRVLLGDNGPVSLNLPISAQLVGALASRSTHPKFLTAFNRLLDELFPVPVRVENPLWDRTRAEGMAVLKEAGCADLLQETLSCSRWSRLPGDTPQCGTCSQCVDRRFAAIAAGLAVHDRVDRYVRDVFVDELPEGHDRTTAESYVRFAQDVSVRSEEELVSAYPQLFDGVLSDDPDPEGTLLTLVDLLRRHAASVLRVLAVETNQNLPTLVAGRLPATCLLVLAPTAPSSMRAITPADTPSVPEPQIRPGGSETRSGTAENVFACDQRVWQLTYRGLTRYLEHRNGLTRIACLLREPRREFTAAELYATAHPSAGDPMEAAAAAREGMWQEGYTGGGTLGDAESDAFVGDHIEMLKEAAARAWAAGDPERAVELDEEAAEAHQLHRTTKGLNNVPRPFPTNRSRSQDAVSRSIRRVLPHIKDAHPPLGEHLERSLRHNPPLSYQPEDGVTWRVCLPTD